MGFDRAYLDRTGVPYAASTDIKVYDFGGGRHYAVGYFTGRLELTDPTGQVFSWAPQADAPWPVLKGLRHDLAFGESFLRHYANVMSQATTPHLELRIRNSRFSKPIQQQQTSQLRFASATMGGGAHPPCLRPLRLTWTPSSRP